MTLEVSFLQSGGMLAYLKLDHSLIAIANHLNRCSQSAKRLHLNTWNTIIEVLRTPAVGELSLADKH